MKVQIVAHAQGTEAWHQHRARSLNASELASVMGLSAYTSRSELIRQKVTGITPEIDAQTQRRFDAGHEFESIARPWAEEIIGGDLYPVVLAGEVDGLNLSASLDGLDMASEISWEHKTGRADLLASLEQGVIPDEYHPQMEMGLMLSGAEKCLFMASSGDKEAMRWAWYLPNFELRAKIIPAWTQFALDLEHYEHTEAAAAPTGRAPDTLPALRIEVAGMVTASNLAEYKSVALSVLGSINRELVTDEQFADAEKTIKWCSDVEARLAAAKQHALSQTTSIDELFRTIDDISAETRRVRLDLDKLVKAQKDAIRADAVMNGRRDLEDHLTALNQRIGRPLMPLIAGDFAGVIKGKRSIDSMHDAVATELARAKIAANEIADRITLNLRAVGEVQEFDFLFADVAQLVLKEPEFVAMVIKNRVADHKAETLARLQAETARIEAQAQARADSQIAAAKQASDDAIARAAAPVAAPVVAPAEPDDSFPFPTRPVEPVAHDAGTTLRLGQISERLGFTVTADFVAGLGFHPVATDKAAKLFREADFTAICHALVAHINHVCELQTA